MGASLLLSFFPSHFAYIKHLGIDHCWLASYWLPYSSSILSAFFFPRALIFYIAFFPVVLQLKTKALLPTNISSVSWVGGLIQRLALPPLLVISYILWVSSFCQWYIRNHIGSLLAQKFKNPTQRKSFLSSYRNLFRMFTLQKFLACSVIASLNDVQWIQCASLRSKNFWCESYNGDKVYEGCEDENAKNVLLMESCIILDLLISRAFRQPSACKTTAESEKQLLYDRMLLIIIFFSTESGHFRTLSLSPHRHYGSYNQKLNSRSVEVNKDGVVWRFV